MFPSPDLGRDPVDVGYFLPDDPEGHPLRCVSFLIPDTIEYRAALYRQVYDLGVTETWDRTDPQKAMLAAEVWTGALQGSFTVFEDDCPVITQIRPDPSGCGNLEQSTDGGVTWTDIPGTGYVKLDGTCTMSGGLEIYPTADEVALTLKSLVNPFNTAKIMRVQNFAGTDVAWINPNGSASFRTNVANGIAVEIFSGGLGLAQNERIFWKDAGAVNRAGLLGNAGILILRGMGSGFQFQNISGNALGTMSEAGTWILRNQTATTGVTKQQIIAGAGQSTSALLEVQTAAFLELLTVNSDGRVKETVQDASAGVVDNLTIDHQSSGTPGANFGAGIRIVGKSSTTNAQNMARLYAAWETATHASRAAKVVLSAFDFSGEKTIIEGGVTGASTPKIGFLGATPQPRLAITGDHHKNPITKQIVEALALFGLITDATTNSAVELVTGEWQGYDVMHDLLTHLEAYTYSGLVDGTSIGDCLLVCEEAPEEFYCKVYDFTTEEGRTGWSLQRGVASGDGFESTMVDEMVFINRGESQNFRITDVTIEYSLSGSGDGTCIIGNYGFTDTVHYDFGTIDAGVGLQIIADLGVGIDFVGFRIVIVSNDPAQEMSLTGLKVTGYDLGLYDVMGNGEVCP